MWKKIKTVLPNIYNKIKILWENPIIKFIIKVLSILAIVILPFLFLFSKINGFVSKFKKEKYEEKIKNLEKEKEKDEKIINGSTANDYDEHGIRIRRKRRKNR